MDYSLPGTSGYGISQARILEWVAISSSRGSSQPRDWTHISCVSWIGRQIFTAEPPGREASVCVYVCVYHMFLSIHLVMDT